MGLVFHIRSGGDFGAEPRGEKPPGARRFVAQNGFCSTKTHLARPLGRVSEKKVRLSKVFQFGGKVRAALFVGKTFCFQSEATPGKPPKAFISSCVCAAVYLCGYSLTHM